MGNLNVPACISTSVQELIIIKADMALLTWSHCWIQGGSHRVSVTPPPLPLFSCLEQKARVGTITLLVAEKGISYYRFPINFEKEVVLPNLSLFSSRPLLKGHVCAGTTPRTRIKTRRNGITVTFFGTSKMSN